MDRVVYGPYNGGDGRKRVIIVFGHKKTSPRKTMAYARFLLEEKLGRKLTSEEHAHHKDEDFTNDNQDNLEVKEKVTHEKEHFSEFHETIKVTCSVCKIEYELTPKQQAERKRNLRYRGGNPKVFCCSRSCVGLLNKDSVRL